MTAGALWCYFSQKLRGLQSFMEWHMPPHHGRTHHSSRSQTATQCNVV